MIRTHPTKETGLAPSLKQAPTPSTIVLLGQPMTYTGFFAGEFLGTFILVFFGCGSVAVTVLF